MNVSITPDGDVLLDRSDADVNNDSSARIHFIGNGGGPH